MITNIKFAQKFNKVNDNAKQSHDEKIDFRCANKLTYTHIYAAVVGQGVIPDLYPCQHEYTVFQFTRTFS